MRFRMLIAVLLCLSGSVAADSFITLADQVRLPLPNGWQALGDTSGFPLELQDAATDARFLIAKSKFAPDETIDNPASLKAAVEMVIDDIIMQLPDAQLLTSTGYYDTTNARFVLEFYSTDTTLDEPLRHRLVGVLYRLSDNSQLLFTLWGKARVTDFAEVDDEIRMMQAGFGYAKKYRQEVFTPYSRNYWPIAAAFLAAVLALWLGFNKQKRKSKAAVTELRTAEQSSEDHRGRKTTVQ